MYPRLSGLKAGGIVMISDSTFLRLLQHPLGRALCYILAYLLIVQPVIWTLPPEYVKIKPLKWFGGLTQSAEAAELLAEAPLQDQLLPPLVDPPPEPCPPVEQCLVGDLDGRGTRLRVVVGGEKPQLFESHQDLVDSAPPEPQRVELG